MKKIISFTTLPSRIDKIEEIVSTLCKQTLQPDEIILWIPKFYIRLKTSVNTIPACLNNYPIDVKYCDTDFGPFTKLRPSLDYCGYDDIIVTCDDDIVYPENWFENLVNHSIKFPDYSIGYRGRKFKDKTDLEYIKSDLIYGSGGKEYVFVDIITGTRGALYKKRFFTEYIYTDNYKKMFLVDDIWISGNLAKAGTKIIVIQNPGFNEKKTISVNLYNIDSLYESNQNGMNNNFGINFFKQYFEEG